MSEVEVRQGREGSRWVNERPSAEDLGAWFKDTVKLHDGMEHGHYVSGLVLISQTETSSEVTGFDAGGAPIISDEVTHLVYTPYPKVETRVAYFLDLCAAKKWTYEIVRERIEAQDGAAPLPDGFFRVALPGQQQGTTASVVGCTVRYEVFDEDKKRVLTGIGTKTVLTNDRYGKADANSFMRAETGAIGRALGMMGMLTIPGSGIATAEDMRESGTSHVDQRADQDQTAVKASTEPEVVDPDAGMRKQAAELLGQLAAFPEDLAEFQAWARGRQFGTLGTIQGTNLKAVLKKAEKALDKAKREHTPPPEDDVELAPPEEEDGMRVDNKIEP